MAALNIANLRALLDDRYVLDMELRAAIAEQGPLPHLIERIRINREDVVTLRVEIDRMQYGLRVYAAPVGVAA